MFDPSSFLNKPCYVAKLLISCVLFVIAPTAMAAPDLSAYDMVFNDEFDGASLDTDKWATSPIWGPYQRTNNEEQYYLDKAGLDATHPVNPFSFDGDKLTIRATPVGNEIVPTQPAENDPIWDQYPEYTYNPDYSPQNRPYFSGLISSVNSFTFTHGYAEARVKVPAGQGLWPAFWQLTNKYVEDAPEIDIMESIGQFPNEVNHTMHYFDTSNDWALVSTPTYKTNGPDYTENFHTYGMMWSPNSVTWFVDGLEVQRTEHTDFNIPKQAMYVIANLAVGGAWPGSPDATTPFPADLQLDYIRVYQRTPPAAITPTTLASDYQLMFSDEFSGNSLDVTKWNTSFLWGPHVQINNEQQVYVDVLDTHSDYSTDPFSISDGTLKITADSVVQSDLPVQPPLGDSYWVNHPERQHNGDYNNTWIPEYTSGIITSYDSFKFIHGYVEYRAKLPSGDGLWPAFWLLNGYYVGAQPEIDILETQGEVPNTSHHSYHYFDTNGNPNSSASTYELPSGDFSDGFHRFGVKWHPGEIVWYVDGVAVRTLNGPEVSLQLMYLLANLAVGGNFVGAVGDDFPATLEIDYIRAYQLREDPVAVAPPPPSPPGVVTPVAPLAEVDTSTPAYVWEDLGGVERYRLWVYDRSLAAVVHDQMYNASDVCVAGVCEVAPDGVSLNFSSNHAWNLRAVNSSGWGPWAPSVSFDYLASPPGVVTPVAPLTEVDTSTPAYVWEDLGGVERYRLWVYDRSLAAVVHDQMYNASDVCVAGVCEVAPDGVSLNFSSNHAWNLRAVNSSGWGPWAPSVSFDYLASPPGVVTPVAPLTEVDTSTPAYVWEDLGGVERYRLWVYDRSLAAVVHDQMYNASDVCVAGVCEVAPDGVSLNFSSNHAWNLRAVNSSGWGPWAPSVSFDYLASPPGVVTPVAPLTEVDTSTPAYVWEDLGGVERYRLWVYDRSLAAVVHDQMYNASDVCVAGVCEVTPDGVSLNFSLNHAWSLRAVNSSGWGPWASSMRFDYLEQ